MKAARSNFQVGLILVLCALQNPVSAQAPVWIWATAFKGDGPVQTLDIVSSSNNGCFVLGTFSNNLYLPFDTLVSLGGTRDYFVAHVDTLGAITWAAQFSDRVVSMHGLENDGVSCLVPYVESTTVNGVQYMSTTVGRSALLITIDNMGSITLLSNIVLTEWPVATDNVVEIRHAEGGGIVFADTFADSILVAGSWVYGNGVYLARLSTEGTSLWAERIGCGSPIPGALHVDGEGRILIGLLDNCMVPEGPFYEEGSLISYTPAGEYEWHQPYILNTFGDNSTMARRQNGNALTSVGFYTQSGETVIRTKEFNGAGEAVWENSLWGSASDNYPSGIYAYGDSATLLGGGVYQTPQFGPWTLLGGGGPNGFIALLDGAGDWLWATAETSGSVFGNHVAPGTNSRIYTTGWSDGNAAFGDHQVSTSMSIFVGFVACLGDVILNTADTQRPLEALNVWPNPTTNILHLSQRFAQGQELHVFDASGRTVLSRVLGSSTSSIDISDLVPGIYLLRIGERQARVVKQ